MALRDKLRISGKVRIDTYRAGMVEAITPHLHQWNRFRDLRNTPAWQDHCVRLRENIENVKAAYFIRTASENHNLVVDNANHGIDLIIQRLVGVNTYSLNILYGEIGTGSTAPALSDTALTTPTNRAAVGFQQNYGSTEAVFQFFFSDSQLANQTYNEFGTYVDGTSTIGSGQLFNHALFSPAYAKVAGQDTTIQVTFSIANA
jgi:hypothetical protein